MDGNPCSLAVTCYHNVLMHIVISDLLVTSQSVSFYHPLHMYYITARHIIDSANTYTLRSVAADGRVYVLRN
jgi:hypothetical protein